MNTTTAAQRTNKRQDAIWERAKELKRIQALVRAAQNIEAHSHQDRQPNGEVTGYVVDSQAMDNLCVALKGWK